MPKLVEMFNRKGTPHLVINGRFYESFGPIIRQIGEFLGLNEHCGNIRELVEAIKLMPKQESCSFIVNPLKEFVQYSSLTGVERCGKFAWKGCQDFVDALSTWANLPCQDRRCYAHQRPNVPILYINFCRTCAPLL